MKEKIRLYHFVPEMFGVSNIENKRLKVSLFEDMNDPFELLAYDCQEADQRESFRLFKEYVNKQTGIICFSKSYGSPLQWAHYADRHKGMCMGFDVAKDYAEEVQYILGRIPWGNVDFNDTKETDAFLRPLMLSKHESWSYEEEFRVWGTLGIPDSNGLHFLKFNEDVVLKEVIFGARSVVTKIGAQHLVADFDGEVQTYKVKPALRTFEMVKLKNYESWNGEK